MESRKGDIMCQHPRPEIYESGGVSKVLLAVVSALDGDTTLMQCATFPEQHTATGQKTRPSSHLAYTEAHRDRKGYVCEIIPSPISNPA